MNLSLALELAKRDIKNRYSGSIFGIWWSFIWPVIMIFIYTVIFSKVLGAKIPYLPVKFSYGIYLATGLLPWNTFANTLSRLTTVFIDNKFILSKIPIKLTTLILAIVIAEIFSFLISFGVLVVILLLLKVKLTIAGFLIFIVSFIIQEIFVTALGTLISVFTVFVRDLKEVVNIFLQLWFWITPIVYTINIVPEEFLPLFKLNPLYYIIEGFHQIIYLNHSLSGKLLLIGMISLLFLFASIRLLKFLEADIRDFI